MGLNGRSTVAGLMQRADFDAERFEKAAGSLLPEVAAAFSVLSEEEREGVVSRIRYAGYIERQQREATRAAADVETRIPDGMSFALPGLSREVVEKLTRIRPISIGQASRIAGITPAAIAALRMHLRRGRQNEVTSSPA